MDAIMSWVKCVIIGHDKGDVNALDDVIGV